MVADRKGHRLARSEAMQVRARKASRVGERGAVGHEIVQPEDVGEPAPATHCRIGRIVRYDDAGRGKVSRDREGAFAEAGRPVAAQRRVQRRLEIADGVGEGGDVGLVVENLARVEIDPQVAHHLAIAVDDRDIGDAGEVQPVGRNEACVAAGQCAWRRHGAGLVVRRIQGLRCTRSEFTEGKLQVDQFLVARPQQAVQLAAVDV